MEGCRNWCHKVWLPLRKGRLYGGLSYSGNHQASQRPQAAFTGEENTSVSKLMTNAGRCKARIVSYLLDL